MIRRLIRLFTFRCLNCGDRLRLCPDCGQCRYCGKACKNG